MKSFNLKDITQLFRQATHRLPVLLSVLLTLLVFFLGGLFVFRVGVLAYKSKYEIPEIKAPKPILVNTDGFKAASDRVVNGRNLVPILLPIARNPFVQIVPATK